MFQKYRICCFTYGKLHELALNAVRQLNDPEMEITCVSTQGQKLNKSIRLALKNNTEVFIAGSSNFETISHSYDIPIVGIEVGYQDYLQHIVEASKKADRIGIACYQNRLNYDFSLLEPFLGIQIKKIIYNRNTDLPEKMRDCGCPLIMGGGYACEVAAQLGLTGVLIYPGIQVIINAFRTAKIFAQRLRKKKSDMMYYAAVIGESPNGIISIDRFGAVTNYNPSAENYLGVTASDALGKQAETLFPQLKLTSTFQQKSRVEDTVVLYHNRQLHLRKILMTEDPAVEAAATALITDLSDFRKSEMSYLIKQRALLSKSGFISKYHFSDILGNCAELKKTLNKAKLYSKTNYNILIFGETGTGKELLAQSICNYSERAGQSFVAVNCAALPDNLLESELFGYQEGAFTGSAKGGHRGLFELANGGTIFLDEIGSVSPALQVKLLRVLQEHEIMRIGDDKIIPVDVRVIAATNKNPEDMLKDGFRMDLLFRLNELELELPPLRRRGEDILLLFRQFLNHKVEAGPVLIPDDDLSLLRMYSWPGNIRELHNVCARFSLFLNAQGEEKSFSRILRECIGEKRLLADVFSRYHYAPGVTDASADMLHDLSDKLGYTQKEIAGMLHISRSTLWRMQKESD
ncbi:Anaerobic nitric oxide reductase transcription regulator NorR [Caprobacter fermentans]|uniref:Anaerobic nitric oxide reductase transcription regulator NorR n=1 Tax=Caproicibacter fermentans TaxID=2576756 RepID=A0A6N8HWP8_9FIRM|nr:sigma 54-interacting transcriptional regulator [Caproicibacter fermentans]MVB10088.1 Anaerobic nitric oxide reductase transcription regulator NorR [Caproicibacter fermentans]QNK40161.1 sigma 54-interacting transcriptional regulator [Caproicibacter fermentans]